MKSIVTKLVIYKKDPRFDYCPTPYYCEGHFVGGGRVLRVMVFKNPSPSGLQPIIDGKGYISHFATCPYANKYRRRDND